MFFFNPKRQVNKSLKKLNASILLITQSGNVLMTADSLRSQSKEALNGRVMEVMISSPNVEPYFIYYENEDYYFDMASGYSQSITTNQDSSNYRTIVSQELCKYLILHVLETQNKDIRHNQMSFSHNRIHTNVIAYVERLKSWYPIRHCSQESDSATERKVAKVNNGLADISEYISIHELSPA